MRAKIYKLILLYLIFMLCFIASGCRMLGPAKSADKYVLPTHREIDNYLEENNLKNVISIDAIDNHYVNILYKVGNNGIGFRVITALKNRIYPMNRVITIHEGKGIYEKMPEIIMGGVRSNPCFYYVYLNESLSKNAYEMRLVYYDDGINEDVEIVELINQKKCFIYSGSKYENLMRDLKSISIYDKNGNRIYVKD